MSHLESFTNSFGSEYFFAIAANAELSFLQSIDALLNDYDKLQNDAGVNAATEVFVRFYLSDITNQLKILQQQLEKRHNKVFCSFVGQPPVGNCKLALQAYHIKAKQPIRKNHSCANAIIVEHNGYQSHWINARPKQPGDAYSQTSQLFGDLATCLQSQKANIQEHMLRTWIYLRDVDNNYQGMVDARRKIFNDIGLNTRTFASTGIEGCTENVTDLVALDAIAVLGAKQQQIEQIQAPEYLCSPTEYDVDFERATKISYGDRAHIYISGTASIDQHGNTVFENDIAKQTERTVVNIKALLASSGAQLTDLKQLTVYLRDPSEAMLVRSVLDSILPSQIPYLMVRGPVCRPSWLVEIEGIAVTKANNPAFAPFC